MRNIPHILHLYWGRNQPLSFMRYMTVRSFVHFNPGWRVVMWHPQCPSQAKTWSSREFPVTPDAAHDHFDDALALPRVTARIVTADMPNVPNDTPEVMKSDLLQWQVMSSIDGGFWSDTDILFTRPMSDLQVPRDADAVLYRHRDRLHQTFYTIGFMAAGLGAARFFSGVARQAHEDLDPTQYQSGGGTALRRYIEAHPPGCVIHWPSPTTIYPVDGVRVNDLYRGFIGIPKDMIGVHWFGGYARSCRYSGIVTADNVDRQRGFLFDHMNRVIAKIGGVHEVQHHHAVPAPR